MARRLSSVCLSVSLCVCKLFCGNRYYDAKNGSIATKLAHDEAIFVPAEKCPYRGFLKANYSDFFVSYYEAITLLSL